jgi:hypothetical protein
MILDEYEEPTIGNKIIRVVVGVFLTILVSMLILTLLPGDAEQNMFKILTGQDDYSAGKIGDETIPPDYFQAARKDCYQRYKEYNPNLSNDSAELNSCAYDTIKTFKIYKAIAHSVGYGISDLKLKEIIWEQAKQVHKESNMGAGYSEEDKLKPEEIYKNILRSTPFTYRQEYMVAMGMDRFLMSSLKTTAGEQKIESEASGAKVSFGFVQFTDSDILSKIGDSPKVSEEEIKADYEKSSKEGTLPKNPEGKIPSFDERKAFIENKIRSEKRQSSLNEIKTKILSLKNQGGKLSEIEALSGKSSVEIKAISITDLSKGNDPKLSFTSTASFLRDLGDVAFGVGKIGGPYLEGEKIVYVEFKDLKIELEGNNQEKKDSNLSNIPIFLMEMNNSLKSVYPVYRKIDKQEN